MSKNQETILKIIQSSDSHMTADEIYMKCRMETSKMSIATVYRNLSIMADNGLIAKISVIGQPDHYDRNVSKHEHIFCECCGRMQDVYIDNLQEFLEDKICMKIESYNLSMRYICSQCKNKNTILHNEN